MGKTLQARTQAVSVGQTSLTTVVSLGNQVNIETKVTLTPRRQTNISAEQQWAEEGVILEGAYFSRELKRALL